MSNLILVAHDPGAAQMLLGIVGEAKWRGHALRFCADGPAVDIWRGQGLVVEQFAAADEAANFELAKWSDIVVSGTGFGPFEITCWSELGRRGVATFAAIDAWTNLEKRFSTHTPGGVLIQPDAIGVVDQYSIDLIVAEGWCSAPLYIVGQPNLQRISGLVKKARKSHKPNRQTTIVFFSEPIVQDFPDGSRGFDQYDVFNQIMLNLPSETICRILVKPHPRECIEGWMKIIGDWSNKVPLSLEITQQNSDDLLSMADGVIGMMTAVLMEAALSNVPVLALQPSRKKVFVPIIDELMPVVTESFQIPEALSSLFKTSDVAVGNSDRLSSIAKNADTRFVEAVELVLQEKAESLNLNAGPIGGNI
jgi:hypothetical protein